jgi:hypothetical protein
MLNPPMVIHNNYDQVLACRVSLSIFRLEMASPDLVFSFSICSVAWSFLLISDCGPARVIMPAAKTNPTTMNLTAL